MNSGKLVVIALLSLVQFGCGGTAKPSGSGEPAKTATVVLTLDPTLKGRLFTIEGKTDLPDGTLIAYEVQHERAADYPIGKLFSDGQATVAGGKYASVVDLMGWPDGKVEVWVAFQTVLGTSKHQPPEIISQFGELGERLEGSNVTKSGALRRVEITKSVTLKAATAKGN